MVALCVQSMLQAFFQRQQIGLVRGQLDGGGEWAQYPNNYLFTTITLKRVNEKVYPHAKCGLIGNLHAFNLCSHCSGGGGSRYALIPTETECLCNRWSIHSSLTMNGCGSLLLVLLLDRCSLHSGNHVTRLC